jgi:hypothetical protein
VEQTLDIFSSSSLCLLSSSLLPKSSIHSSCSNSLRAASFKNRITLSQLICPLGPLLELEPPPPPLPRPAALIASCMRLPYFSSTSADFLCCRFLISSAPSSRSTTASCSISAFASIYLTTLPVAFFQLADLWIAGITSLKFTSCQFRNALGREDWCLQPQTAYFVV